MVDIESGSQNPVPELTADEKEEALYAEAVASKVREIFGVSNKYELGELRVKVANGEVNTRSPLQFRNNGGLLEAEINGFVVAQHQFMRGYSGAHSGLDVYSLAFLSEGYKDSSHPWGARILEKTIIQASISGSGKATLISSGERVRDLARVDRQVALMVVRSKIGNPIQQKST
jgi:hypothetical protein